MYSNDQPSGQKRYLVLLDENRIDEGISALQQRANLDSLNVASSADTEGGIIPQEQKEQSNVLMLHHLGLAVVNEPLDLSQGQSLIASADESNVPIVAVIEEETWYAFQEEPIIPPEPTLEVSRKYLEGYRDGVNNLIDKLTSGQAPETEAAIAAIGEASTTWGLQMTNVTKSPYSGRGIRVAVLDTGLDLQHPDFVGRTIVSQSFIATIPSPQDGNGHGTHCIGTACGPLRPQILPRYGVAYESEIYVGKVLNNDLPKASGSTADIVNGMNWAVANGCAVISMSLGGRVSPGQSYDNFYEIVGSRALDRGCLIIAAAGNDSQRPSIIVPVSRPANCPSIMAVAALDSELKVPYFSNGGINPNGGNINLAGPGVNVYSTVPMPNRYGRKSGTSMATPHLAGIAALYAQKTGQRGRGLWQLLTSNARRLPLPTRDVGIGLAQAPTV